MARRLGTRKRRLLVDALIERDGLTCTWCCCLLIDLPIDQRRDCANYMTLEHILPLVLGGGHELRNLALACHTCNHSRGSDLTWGQEVA